MHFQSHYTLAIQIHMSHYRSTYDLYHSYFSSLIAFVLRRFAMKYRLLPGHLHLFIVLFHRLKRKKHVTIPPVYTRTLSVG